MHNPVRLFKPFIATFFISSFIFCMFSFAGKIGKAEHYPSVPHYTLIGIKFINADTAFAVGNSGSILKTINGGNTWVEQTSGTKEDLFDLYFRNADTGYVVGARGVILKTTNGGNAWVEQNSGNKKMNLYSVRFNGAKIGYVIGERGRS